MIMPNHLVAEEKRLFNKYWSDQSIERIGALEYAEKYGSEELKQFYKDYDAEKMAAAAEGWIIN